MDFQYSGKSANSQYRLYIESNASSDYIGDVSILPSRIPKRRQNSENIESEDDESTVLNVKFIVFRKWGISG